MTHTARPIPDTMPRKPTRIHPPRTPATTAPHRKRLPDERDAVTHRFTVGGHKGYLHIGLYPDTRRPGEVFIKMAKEGSTLSGVMDAFATNMSIALQYGVPLAHLCDKMRHMRFEPQGFTSHPDIPSATSVMDYIAQYLALRWGEDEGESTAQ